MTKHDKKVAEFMRKAGQRIPDVPSLPTKEPLTLRARLILEETLETIKAMGMLVTFVDGDGERTILTGNIDHYDIDLVDSPDVEEVLDGLADIRVVTTGTFLAMGVDPESIQDPVDDSNLAKFSGDGYRRDDGKWIKPTDWQAPDLIAAMTPVTPPPTSGQLPLPLEDQ